MTWSARDRWAFKRPGIAVPLTLLLVWVAGISFATEGWLVEVGQELGIDFVQDHGGSGQR